ncbi:MAG: CRISPR-associated helicase Cas3' [bacterium]
MKSSSSFESFMTIWERPPTLEHRLTDHQKYLAHTHDSKPPELLSEHTRLVSEYALRLIEVHHLDPVVDRLVSPLAESNDHNRVGFFIKKLFLNAIIFHDYGKVNENFQVEKMQNERFSKNSKNGIGSRHSILSAFIFIVEHLREVQEMTDLKQETQARLFALTFLFANPILKHHASYLANDLKFDEQSVLTLAQYLALFGLEGERESLLGAFHDLKRKLTDVCRDYFSDEARFPIYALLKLNYSLLTAADYYATNSYSMGLTVEDFGVFSEKQKQELFTTFQTSKDYNRGVFGDVKQFENYPVHMLQTCHPDNLNILRKKLLAEVLESVRQNCNEIVFYLEAPTGSGKTNVSIGAAVELLQSDPSLNKIFYVFPFTTLVTQTARAIQDTLQVSNAEMIQLHSRSGFHSKREADQDGSYGADKQNYIDNLFVNYPITLLTHIKFFDILKGNGKTETYLLHRLANSIVIIDELQSYPPLEWDKVAYFIRNYAQSFNIKFILMSATLPKLDLLEMRGGVQDFVPLVRDKNLYFLNPNFKNRVRFDFSLLEQQPDLIELAHFVLEKCEAHVAENEGRVKAVVEFILKKRAGEFYNEISIEAKELGYEVLLLSGTILEPRRREMIDFLKSHKESSKKRKVLLVSTQVVEAGVDIDMDIGFKDRSLIDSDEQLAGRVNRNAAPTPACVYIFDLDRTFSIYGRDFRYQITRDNIGLEEYKSILSDKQFDRLYKKVCEKINEDNQEEYCINLDDYLDNIKRLEFTKVNSQFRLIDQQSVTVFVPLEIPKHHFSSSDLRFLANLGWDNTRNVVSGRWVWQSYLNLIHAQDMDFIEKKMDLKRIYGIMSQFMFSMHAHSHDVRELLRFSDGESSKKYDMIYLENWQEVYDYKDGLLTENLNGPAFL